MATGRQGLAAYCNMESQANRTRALELELRPVDNDGLVLVGWQALVMTFLTSSSQAQVSTSKHLRFTRFS